MPLGAVQSLDSVDSERTVRSDYLLPHEHRTNKVQTATLIFASTLVIKREIVTPVTGTLSIFARRLVL